MTNIHSTVPAKQHTRHAEDLAEKVYKVLGRGKRNAMTTDVIAGCLGYRSKGTNVNIRTACKILLEIQNKPVISCNRGMFIAATNSELVEYRENIEARAQGLYRILAALKTVEPEAPQRERAGLFDEPINGRV